MASILPPGKVTFYNTQNIPLVLGTVDFYEPGTTTRKTTYQDIGLTTPNTNPVVLDTYGQAVIWGSGSYRQVVKDSSGNLIWDQVTSAYDGTAASSGANTDITALLGLTSPIPGSDTPVKSASTTAPPASPSDGDRYIVPTGSSGAWSAQATKIAQWSSDKGTWYFSAPIIGTIIYVQDVDVRQIYTGSAWTAERIFNLKWFGAKGDGTSDDYAAIVSAITAAGNGGGIVYAPPGTYGIASSTSSSIAVPNNVTILGSGRDVSVFKVLGMSQLDNLFVATNPNNVWFKDVGFYGNSVTTNNAAAGAIQFLGAPGAAANMFNFGCVGIHASNFKQPYWVWVLNESAYTMNTGRFIDCTFTSYSGNMINSADIGYPSMCISFWGQWSNVAGFVNDMIIDRMYADCTYIKTGAAFWSGVSGGVLSNSTILNAGQNASANCGAYGSFAYLNDVGSVGASPATNITWKNNVITNAQSNGIYAAQLTNGVIDGNRISGQSDTTTANPDVKAAIGLGLIKNTVVTNNILDNNYAGIIMRGNGTTKNIAANNIITSNVASAKGIIVKGQATFTTDLTETHLYGNAVYMSGTSSVAISISSVSGSSQTPGYVKIIGGRYSSTSTVISSFDSTTLGGAVCVGIDIGNVFLAGAPTIALQHQSTSTPLYLTNITVDGTSWSGTVNGLDLRSATVLNISGASLKNRASGSGVMLELTGARGSMSGVQFYNVGSSQRVTSTDFGTAVPTWSATQGTFIQNLNPTGAGHLHGYTNTSSGSGTTWTED